jgi:hypothetical protein
MGCLGLPWDRRIGTNSRKERGLELNAKQTDLANQGRRSSVKLMVAIAILVVGGLAGLTAGSAQGAIHEIAAAYCSGGDHGVIDEDGFVEPTPLEDAAGTTPSAGHAFAKPVLSSGAVEVAFPEVLITDQPNVKFEEGTVAVNLLTGESEMDSSTVDHASAEHCPKNALP